MGQPQKRVRRAAAIAAEALFHQEEHLVDLSNSGSNNLLPDYVPPEEANPDQQLDQEAFEYEYEENELAEQGQDGDHEGK